MARQLTVAAERWPVRGSFTISRGSVSSVELVVVTLEEDGATGRGECRPYPRYGESVEATVAALETVHALVESGADRHEIGRVMPPGAARNALDCALWDLEAKCRGEPVWRLAGLPEPRPVLTAYTLGLDTPERMAKAAREATGRPLLKLKLGGEGDVERVAAVRAAAPSASLICDANEAWSPDQLRRWLPDLAALGVELIEQPLPAGEDAALAELARLVPICADESCHGSDGLRALVGRYDCVNLKLDKTGGLTEARHAVATAQELGLAVMVGCMVATSLAMAPAVLLAQLARYADLDGPLLLARDREPGLRYDGSWLYPPDPALWG
jgi:L-alanine-DL-glutamate epimerase-like enolase superfamily enzyme